MGKLVIHLLENYIYSLSMGQSLKSAPFKHNKLPKYIMHVGDL